MRRLKKGFANDTESGVIFRYRIQSIVADVMPTGENALVFTDRWYGAVYAHSIVYDIDGEHRVRIFSPAYFLASKREAFTNRGGGDGRRSSDFEDLVYVLNNRTVIWNELRGADEEVKHYRKEQFRAWLQIDCIDEWTAVRLERSEQKRLRTIVGELTAFVQDGEAKQHRIEHSLSIRRESLCLILYPARNKILTSATGNNSKVVPFTVWQQTPSPLP